MLKNYNFLNPHTAVLPPSILTR